MTVSEARASVEMASPHLAKETIDSTIYWMPQDMPALHGDSPTSYLLPGFDEFMLGYKDRGASLDPLHAQKIVPGNNGMFSPTIVMDGRVVGTWQRTLKKNAVVIKTTFFTDSSNDREEHLGASAQKYGTFLGLPSSIQTS